MDRITFFNSISGIDYPEMLVKFYDQFLALKDLVYGANFINVTSNTQDDYITFSIVFSEARFKEQTLSIIYNNRILVYGKPITINIDSLTDTELIITLS